MKLYTKKHNTMRNTVMLERDLKSFTDVLELIMKVHFLGSRHNFNDTKASFTV
ncbi:hypothetical protein Hanom_Chr16g01442501 [Helianthus anomalus]